MYNTSRQVAFIYKALCNTDIQSSFIVINRKNNRINHASFIKYETNSVKQLLNHYSARVNVDSDQFNNSVDLWNKLDSAKKQF